MLIQVQPTGIGMRKHIDPKKPDVEGWITEFHEGSTIVAIGPMNDEQRLQLAALFADPEAEIARAEEEAKLERARGAIAVAHLRPVPPGAA